MLGRGKKSLVPECQSCSLVMGVKVKVRGNLAFDSISSTEHIRSTRVGDRSVANKSYQVRREKVCEPDINS